MPTKRNNVWKIISRSVDGPLHIRLGLPNQDCVQQRQNDITAVAVSDGHGSAKCFRSDSGARFATETALDVIERIFTGDWSMKSFADASVTLTREITRDWLRKVEEHLEASPFTQQERENLASQHGEGAFLQVEKHPPIAYGATLIAVAIREDHILYLQLGDGDILAVDESGEVRRPLSADDRLFANETTSLSSENAWKDFRVRLQFLPRGLPSLILLSTDGYSNSFKDDASFLKAGSDFLELLRSEGGTEEVETCLKDWLLDSSEMSGDDVTVSLVYRKTPDLASLPVHVKINQETGYPAPVNEGDDSLQKPDNCNEVL